MVDGTSLGALTVDNLRTGRTFALVAGLVVSGIKRTSNTVAVQEEEVSNALRADSLLETVASNTLAFFSGRVVFLIDSASENALTADEDGSILTLTANSLGDFSVALNAHADSVSLLAVGRAGVAKYASVVRVINVVSVAGTEDSVEMAIWGTGVMRGNTVLVLFDEAISAYTLSVLQVAVVRAQVGRSTFAVHVADESLPTDALVANINFVVFAVLGWRDIWRVDGSDDDDLNALATGAFDSVADSA